MGTKIITIEKEKITYDPEKATIPNVKSPPNCRWKLSAKVGAQVFGWNDTNKEMRGQVNLVPQGGMTTSTVEGSLFGLEIMIFSSNYAKFHS